MAIQSDNEAEKSVGNGANLFCNKITEPSSCFVQYSNTTSFWLAEAASVRDYAL